MDKHVLVLEHAEKVHTSNLKAILTADLLVVDDIYTCRSTSASTGGKDVSRCMVISHISDKRDTGQRRSHR